MRKILEKIAAILAFVIGAMAVFAGGKVLIGIDPGYYVIDWVPVYNFTAGLFSILIAFLIWKRHRFARPAAVTVLFAHSIVMTVLLGPYRDVVAAESITAMTTRIGVWTIILALMIIPSLARSKARAASGEQQAG